MFWRSAKALGLKDITWMDMPALAREPADVVPTSTLGCSALLFFETWQLTMISLL